MWDPEASYKAINLFIVLSGLSFQLANVIQWTIVTGTRVQAEMGFRTE